MRFLNIHNLAEWVDLYVTIALALSLLAIIMKPWLPAKEGKESTEEEKKISIEAIKGLSAVAALFGAVFIAMNIDKIFAALGIL